MTLYDSELIALMLPGFGCDIDSMLELNNSLEDSQSIKYTECMIFASQVSLEEMALEVEKQYPHSDLLLVGLSMGGWVAQEVASRMRSQVKGMILISSWTEAPSRYLDTIQNLHKEIKSGKTLDSLRPIVVEGFASKKTRDAMADRWVSMASRIGPEIFLRQTKAILEHPSVISCISDIQCPVLAIAGASDALLTPADQFKHLQDQNIYQTLVLESCGHNLIWEQPLKVSNVVKKWLHLSVES